MVIAMLMMQSLEMFPIWLFCVVVVQFSDFSLSHIFPFPLSPFPFPLSPFPKYTNKLSAQTTEIRIKLKLSHTQLSTTGVQLLSKQGGLCFLWRLFSFGGGEGGWKAPDSGGGGDGWGGVSCEEFGVDNGGGGGGGIGPLDPPPVHKNITHLRGQTAHTTSLIRHQTSDLIHIAAGLCRARYSVNGNLTAERGQCA